MKDSLEELGVAVDAASDAGDAQALRVLDARCAELISSLTGSDEARGLYFRSNVQASLHDLQPESTWQWHPRHRKLQIFLLRQTAAHGHFGDLPSLVRAQVLTNLGNAMSWLGRTFEAISIYDDALVQQPQFAMALANRGSAKLALARSVYDHGHALVLAAAAHSDFSEALGDDAVWDGEYPGARASFAVQMGEIEERVDLEEVRRVDLDGWTLGRSRKEQEYRRWGVRHRLFLNPLNELGAHSITACDILNLPDHRTAITDPPHFVSWFNGLKLEFATARLLLHEGEAWPDVHFADHELHLVNTLDYPAYGITLEKVRLSFRSSYSMLDKIAGFLNAYLKLGIDPDEVSIRNVWERRGSMRSEFRDRENYHLRALYWLSFDVVGDDPGKPDTIAPGAADLHRLRNLLEHRAAVFREMVSDRPSGLVEAFPVEVLHDAAMRMLRLVRAALMHLSLAVHVEERRRPQEHLLAQGMELPTYRRPTVR